jgi:type IV pilus assembly protein PilB
MIRTSFLNALVEENVIRSEQIPELVRIAKEKYQDDVDEALVKSGAIEEDRLLELKGHFYNIPTRRVAPEGIAFNVFEYISEDSAKHYGIVPLAIEDKVLMVGILDPENVSAIDVLEFISAKFKLPFKIFIISKGDFTKVLQSYKGATSDVSKAILSLEKGDSLPVDRQALDNIPELEMLSEKQTTDNKIVEDAPIVRLVDNMINLAVQGNASDIHIENLGNKVQVRFRVDGVLHPSLTYPLKAYPGIVARIKYLAQLQLDQNRKPQDGGYTVIINEGTPEQRKIDLRISTFPSVYGEKVEMRILDTDKGVKKLEEIGMSAENLRLTREALTRPFGLILITGPTGSGKSTTLYSMLNEIDRIQQNVVSLEDPVEYHIPNVTQSQIKPDIGYTFATGLRSILRQDPNVIMVGEIRDKETAELAIQAALTGHLVLSTLHTNSAIGAIPRLIDMGIDPYLIAPTLILSIAQRLARVVCESSKKKVPMSDAVKEIIDKQFADLPEAYKKTLPIGNEMYEVIPSNECRTGTKGRLAVFEMFKIDDEIEHLILTNPVEPELYKALRAKGMITMREDALLKSLQGKVPFQEVYAEL